MRQGVCQVVALAAVLAGLQVASAAPAAAVTVSGFGNYCSATNANGSWSVLALSSGDPCATITSSGPGWTVQRKGLWSPTGLNNVVARCNTAQTYVLLFRGTGLGPATAAVNKAKADKQSKCIFTISPANLAVFQAPFPLTTAYTHVTGFDFARPPYTTLKVSDFGQVGSATATKVDWKGLDKSPTQYIDNHDAIDYVMPRGTSIKAVSDGKVVMARNFATNCADSDSTLQKEVAILHTVKGTNGYMEQFVTYYAHLSSWSVTVGNTVTAGQEIAKSGNTGCSSDPHLHFAVIRVSNTASKLSAPVTWYADSRHNSGKNQTTSPYGWTPANTAAPDPWAWRAYPAGALSINLWKSGQAPTTGNW